MARVLKAYAHTPGNFLLVEIFQAHEMRQAFARIIHGIERLYRWFTAFRASFTLVFSVFLLDPRAVLQQNVGHITRRVLGVYFPPVSASHQQWQTTAMIDMRVTQYHRIYLTCVKRKIGAIERTCFTATLD